MRAEGRKTAHTQIHRALKGAYTGVSTERNTDIDRHGHEQTDREDRQAGTQTQ